MKYAISPQPTELLCCGNNPNHGGFVECLYLCGMFHASQAKQLLKDYESHNNQRMECVYCICVIYPGQTASIQHPGSASVNHSPLGPVAALVETSEPGNKR